MIRPGEVVGSNPSDDDAGDLLVRGGMLVDGSGSPARRADVRVRAGRVVEIGAELDPSGEPEIDASNAVVSPGFVDTHTHLDPTVFWDPTCDPLPQHGVTTVVFGNCGLSLAPVHRRDIDSLSELFCYIEDLPLDVFRDAVPFSWETYDEYLDDAASRRYSVNVAGMVGHSVLRQYVLGVQAWERAATSGEVKRMASLLDQALLSGAIGMSTSVGFDTDRDKRPVPSRQADDAELRALFEVLAARRKIVQFIPSTIPKYLTRDVRRVADVSRGLPLTQTWINVMDDDRRPQYAPSLMELAAELQREGVATYPQISPRPLDIEVNWEGGMSFYTMEHSWHRAVQASPDEKRRLLADPQWRARAREDWDTMPFTLIEHRRPDHIRLNSVESSELSDWVGRSFAELCTARGGHPSDVMADWVLDNDLKPGIVATGVANGDPDGVARLLAHPAGVFSNSDAGAHVQMMCAAGDTTLMLTRHVRDRHDLSLEQAIHQMTSRPAEVFGVTDRGVVAVDHPADLVVFALEELRWEPATMTADLPLDAIRQRRPAGGYRATLVDGVITQRNDELTNSRPGRLIRT